MLWLIIRAAVLWQGAVWATGYIEKNQVYIKAREYADNVGKPLLVIGGPGAGENRSLIVQLLKLPEHPCGDVCIDTAIQACSVCGATVERVQADIRRIPYPDKYFGAVFVSHVLEHLPTVADAEQAVAELKRVADQLFVVSPHKLDFSAWVHPDHHLWVYEVEGQLSFESRN